MNKKINTDNMTNEKTMNEEILTANEAIAAAVENEVANAEEEVTETDEETDNETDEVIIHTPTNILDAMESILEFAEDSELDGQFLDTVDPLLDYLSDRLELTKDQALFLTLFVNFCDHRSITLGQMADYLNCKTIRVMRFTQYINELEQLRYIRCCRCKRNDTIVTYRIPGEVMDALQNDKPYKVEKLPITDTESFFEGLNPLFEEKNDDEITYKQVNEEVTEMLESIKDSQFCQDLDKLKIDADYRLLFIFMAHLFVENDDDAITLNDLSNLYDNKDVPHWVKSSLRNKDSELQQANLIEFAPDGSFMSREAFKLTDYAKETILAELNLQPKAKPKRDLIPHDSFAAKKLIYNADEQKQVAQLTELLKPKRFSEVQDRLAKTGMRKGFCCIFHGAPGTGKTETVQQIARLTGRDIMRIDVDKIKNCFVGESEKNIKRAFVKYRKYAEEMECAPILLFNEADSILGVRMENATRSVDKMENSIQNIILQEMETFEGIMIATTNLTSNLDKAFERRFIYKIRFDKPSVEARSEIWQAMMPSLAAADAKILAREFDMSGGEIENIVRKQTVDAILSDEKEADLPKLKYLCSHERLNNGKSTRIGF